jgi:hypothetical protein
LPKLISFLPLPDTHHPINTSPIKGNVSYNVQLVLSPKIHGTTLLKPPHAFVFLVVPFDQIHFPHNFSTKPYQNSLNSPLNSRLNSLTFKVKVNSFDPALNPQFHTIALPMFTIMLTKTTFPFSLRNLLNINFTTLHSLSYIISTSHFTHRYSPYPF